VAAIAFLGRPLPVK
jgi:hypothetical protein